MHWMRMKLLSRQVLFKQLALFTWIRDLAHNLLDSFTCCSEHRLKEGIREKNQVKISFYHAGKLQLWEIWCPSSATLYGRKRRRRRWRKQDRDARYMLSSVKTLLQTISQTWATSFTINLYCSSTWLQLEVQIFIAEALHSSWLTFFFIRNFRFDPDTPCLPPPLSPPINFAEAPSLPKFLLERL